MSIFTPEIFTTFGAIDSDALADGQPYSSHLLRTIVMNGNRLASKGHEMLNLIWPVTTSVSETQWSGAWVPLHSFWRRILGPVVVPKKVGLRTATAQLHAKILGSQSALFQFTTRARPFNSGARATDVNCLEITGDSDDDYDSYTLTGVPLDRQSALETIEIWVIASGDTATASGGGTPTSGTFTSLERDKLTLSSATWNTTSGSKWSDLGHELQLVDSGGSIVVPPVGITDVPSATELEFSQYNLSDSELEAAREAGDFQIVRPGLVGFSNIALFADGRSD